MKLSRIYLSFRYVDVELKKLHTFHTNCNWIYAKLLLQV